MSTLFGEYELLKASSLFDAAFYRSMNPEIASLNMDPLLHYLESGSAERRDPSAAFNTAHYLQQCERLGEKPANPLAHYLTFGIGRGLTPAPGAVSSAALLYVDIPKLHDGVAETPVHGGLAIVGWGLTQTGTGSVEIALNGVRVTSVRCGLRRPDVVAAHPGRAGGLLSGYAAHLPPKILPVGRHQITVSLFADGHAVQRADFQIDVREPPDTSGPWSLRRNMRAAEVLLKQQTLQALGAAPEFIVAMRGSAGRDRDASRRSFDSLRRQTYRNFRVQRPRAPTRSAGPRSCATRRWLLMLAPGDELGCDALLELALSIGRQPAVDLFYCDERRRSKIDGRLEAFFKPAWSPDLLLSSNYLGRSWCADEQLLARAGLSAAVLQRCSDYALALRVTEAAACIGHVPLVLWQSSDKRLDSAAQERRALAEALKRREVAGEVQATAAAGCYRVRRRLARPRERVSIIIPTCGAQGLVKTCIQSLRSHTDHQDYEILVIENLGQDQRELLRWLRAQADMVIRADGSFNWSLYNNQAAAQARGKYLLFLNDDIECIDGHWLHALLEHAQRAEVGVVGARLLYPDLSVQHAGVMLDSLGRGRHAFRHLPDDEPGYFGLAASTRNVISVTGACLMTRRETFEALGRFDAAHAVINNDLDYCLRAWERGLLNVYTPHARLIHHELASRSHLPERYDSARFAQRWAGVIAAGDPYFNVNLSRDDETFAIDREPLETLYAGHPVYRRDSVRRILVTKLDHIGDCITALPALRRLQGHFPAAKIAVLAARATLPIWRNEPVVSETLEFNYFRTRSGAGKHDVSAPELEKLAQSLRAKRFDLAVDLRKQPDSRFVLPLSGASLLAGFDHQGRFPWLDMALEWDEDVPLRSKHGHVADDLVALVDMIAAQGETARCVLPTWPAGPPALPPALRRRLGAKPLVCVHPCAGSPMRQWPLAHFSALIDRLLDQDDCQVALIGGDDETALGRQVRKFSRRADQVIDLTGTLNLEELMQLLATAAVFVGNNSGPQHLAAGLGVATVGIHSGVVDAREWGPLGPRALAIRRDMSCSPCYIEHAKDCPRQLACLEQLPVAAVYSECRQMLALAS